MSPFVWLCCPMIVPPAFDGKYRIIYIRFLNNVVTFSLLKAVSSFSMKSVEFLILVYSSSFISSFKWHGYVSVGFCNTLTSRNLTFPLAFAVIYNLWHTPSVLPTMSFSMIFWSHNWCRRSKPILPKSFHPSVGSGIQPVSVRFLSGNLRFPFLCPATNFYTYPVLF